MEKITFDKRIKWAKDRSIKGQVQMIGYFAARYSWGQPCDPLRAKDWGTLCGHLAALQWRGQDPDWDKVYAWPSGNRGTLSGLVNLYHDGWALLEDLGLWEPEDLAWDDAA